ncbi:MAG: hypothetical protein QOE28_547 [Solirubrobacteraceae bacterium]|jgi:hypothetical protein|nr:hypothetical protein [Solirubrobacteraceae bacterium]
MRTTSCLILTAAAIGLAPSAAGAAAPAPAPSADLPAMALRRADLPAGTRILSEGYLPGSTAVYLRTLQNGRLRSVRRNGALVESFVGVAPTSAAARSDLADTRRSFASRAGRLAFIRQFAGSQGLRLGNRHLAPPRTLPIGDAAFEFRFELGAPIGTLHLVFAGAAVGRAETIVFIVAQPRSRLAGSVGSLLRTATDRARAKLPPDSNVAPAIAGEPVVGGQLSASAGTWTGAHPAGSFAYQWLRCDPTGASCSEIPDATASVYTVTAADQGAAIRIQVTATSPDGSGTAISDPTPPAHQ